MRYCFVHRCRSRQIFGGSKEFCPNFRKLAQKNFGPLFVRIFSHDDRFWDDLQKRSSCDSAHVGRHFFQIKTRCEAVSRFPWIFRDFSWTFTKSKLLGVRFHSCTPTSYTTGFMYNNNFIDAKSNTCQNKLSQMPKHQIWSCFVVSRLTNAPLYSKTLLLFRSITDSAFLTTTSWN